MNYRESLVVRLKIKVIQQGGLLWLSYGYGLSGSRTSLLGTARLCGIFGTGVGRGGLASGFGSSRCLPSSDVSNFACSSSSSFGQQPTKPMQTKQDQSNSTIYQS